MINEIKIILKKRKGEKQNLNFIYLRNIISVANSRSRFSQVPAERISQTFFFSLCKCQKFQVAFAHVSTIAKRCTNSAVVSSLKERKKERKKKSLAVVTGLWNMQEWECDSGEQRRVSRVQMPRNFVHPWVICGAMPNAGELFNMHTPAGCSCTRARARVFASQKHRPPTNPLPAIAACIRMTITELPWLKERSRNLFPKDLSLLLSPTSRNDLYLKKKRERGKNIQFF